MFYPSQIAFEQLCIFFFNLHDPSTLNRQGVDVGTQYRSGIYTTSHQQEETAREVRDLMQKNIKYQLRKIVTEIEPA